MLKVEAIETAEIVGGSKPGWSATVGWRRAVAVAVGGKSRTPTSAGAVAALSGGAVAPIAVGLKTKPISAVGVSIGAVAVAGRRTVSGKSTVGAGVQVTARVGRGGGVASSLATSVSFSVGKAVSVGSNARGAMMSESVVAVGRVASARCGRRGGCVSAGSGVGGAVAVKGGMGGGVAVSVAVGEAVAAGEAVALGGAVLVAVAGEVAEGSIGSVAVGALVAVNVGG